MQLVYGTELKQLTKERKANWLGPARRRGADQSATRLVNANVV